MNKKELFIGFIIGIIASFIGIYLFVTLFMGSDFMEGIQMMKAQGKLGKIITLGSILDLVLFGILLKLNKELMARGVILAVICIAILTVFA